MDRDTRNEVNVCVASKYKHNICVGAGGCSGQRDRTENDPSEECISICMYTYIYNYIFVEGQGGTEERTRMAVRIPGNLRPNLTHSLTNTTTYIVLLTTSLFNL